MTLSYSELKMCSCTDMHTHASHSFSPKPNPSFDHFEPRVNTCLGPAIDYISTYFGVEAQAVFVLEHRQTDTQRQTDTTKSPIHAGSQQA